MRWRRDAMNRRGRKDESGQALVEFALVLPLVILLVSVAFNGWNGIQLDLRLTSAARAGALIAASDLSADLRNNPGQPLSAGQIQTATDDATTKINDEEGVTGVYQDSPSGGDNHVTLSQSQDTVSGPQPITVNIVTISISQASVVLVPVIGNISVSAHAAAEYS
jgi:Flp pilus assembly protein TadG